ncbi:hypothetical protein LO771_30280, partial [Streptacidiphilus sp. ASG 303]|nr:hypothetical protein [Streptacidiphilus sp. ASG 303]
AAPRPALAQAAARRQAAAAERRRGRPAGSARRLCARAVDTLVVAALAAAVGIPLASSAVHHLQEKSDAAKASGRSVRVWLIDPTVLGKAGLFLLVVLC